MFSFIKVSSSFYRQNGLSWPKFEQNKKVVIFYVLKCPMYTPDSRWSKSKKEKESAFLNSFLLT